MHRGRRPSLRRALRNLLLSLRVGVETFESGGAFLEAGNRGRIACLLLDVRLAGMSGVNVLRQLAGVAIPTIVRTVHDDDETRSHRTGREGPRAPFDSTFRITDVYRKRHGKWVIVQEHISLPPDVARW